MTFLLSIFSYCLLSPIKNVFVDSLNEKLSNREEVLENLKEIRNLLSGGEKTLQQQTALWQEGKLLEEQIQALIMQNARIAMDQEKYQKEFDELLLVSMVYHVVVHSKEDIRVVYRDGIEK